MHEQDKHRHFKSRAVRGNLTPLQAYFTQAPLKLIFDRLERAPSGADGEVRAASEAGAERKLSMLPDGNHGESFK